MLKIEDHLDAPSKKQVFAIKITNLEGRQQYRSQLNWTLELILGEGGELAKKTYSFCLWVLFCLTLFQSETPPPNLGDTQIEVVLKTYHYTAHYEEH